MRFTMLVLALALVGCGGDDTEVTKETPEDTGDTGPEWYPDADQDGYTSDVDCNDNDYRIHPDADEECDEVDNDCDEEIDEGFDADVDGYFSAALCDYGDDCDDTTSTIHPGADEVPYNGIDEDCDGEDLRDVDGDGYEAVEVGGFDCDDEDASVNPEGEEIAKDGIDQDCDGVDLLDGDGDGYDDAELGGDDCDDEDATVHPGAFDWMNDGIDADCDDEDGKVLEMADAEITVMGDLNSLDLLGHDVVACDLDEDGMDDLVLSAPFSDSYYGRVGIFYGSGSATWSKGMKMSDADVVITGSDYFLGMGVVCADIDGDGHEDLGIARGEIDLGSYVTDWELLLFYGSGSSLSASLDDADADAILTYELGVPTDTGEGNENTVVNMDMTTGDLDSDGASEVFIEATRLVTDSDSDYTYFREVEYSHIVVLPGARYSSNSDMADEIDITLRMDSIDAANRYQGGVSVVTDIDGDGMADVYVGQAWVETDTADTASDTGWDHPGQASFLPLPSSSGDFLREHAIASYWGQDDWLFGSAAAFADLDADTLMDGAISAIREDSNREDAGAVFFFSDLATSASALNLDAASTATATVLGQTREGYLGTELEMVGDADGNGYNDVLVVESSGGGGDVGMVWLFGGDLIAGEVDAEYAAILAWEGESSSAETGNDLAAGDFDGDGSPDFVIAAYATPTGGTNTGKVYVYLSSGY